MKKLILIFTLLFLSSVIFSQGLIINVPADQPTIQSAINISSDGDTVLVSDGTYFENINFRGKAIIVSSHFLINKDENHIDSTIINGSQPTHPDSASVVTFNQGEDTTSVLYGFTITGGSGNIDPHGYGAFGGGGIGISSGAKIQFNKITGNVITADFPVGGGIICESKNSTLILDNWIHDNKLISSDANIEGGGGIFCYEATSDLIIIARNIISNNKVLRTNGSLNGYGGGITLNSSKVFLQNNLIKNNYAYRGGGVHINNLPLMDKPVIINNTIVNNKAEISGGYFGDAEGSVPMIYNSILWGNTAPLGGQIYHTVYIYYSDVQGGYEGPGNLDLDPLFADTVNYYLDPLSPCVDSGHPFSVYYDVTDPENPSSPQFPALGKMRNDMGYCGGNLAMAFAALPDKISELKSDFDSDYIPDRLNETVTTTGVVTSINFQESSGNLEFYIQDDNFGINVFANDDSTIFEIGDWVEVKGKVYQEFGQTKIVVSNPLSDLHLLESDHTANTTDLYIDEILQDPEQYEGRLVRIKALKKSSGDWPLSNVHTNLEITDGYKYFELKIDDDTDLGNNPEPVYPMDLVGIVTQYTNSVPADQGYQLLLNSYKDIEQNVQAAPSPYFFFTTQSKQNENESYGITDSSLFVASLDWYQAIDLNEDDLTYEVAVIRNEDGVIVSEGLSDNNGKLNRQSRSNAQMLDFIQEYGTYNETDGYTYFTGSWIVRVSDGITDTITSVDTLKNFTLIDMVTNYDEKSPVVPDEFSLSQNYPNPFNPTTTISYTIPASFSSKTANVKLFVYDILGKEIAILVNQKQKSGFYEVVWDAKNIPSGIYFLRLISGKYAATRKMILLQ